VRTLRQIDGLACRLGKCCIANTLEMADMKQLHSKKCQPDNLTIWLRLAPKNLATPRAQIDANFDLDLRLGLRMLIKMPLSAGQRLSTEKKSVPIKQGL